MLALILAEEFCCCFIFPSLFIMFCSTKKGCADTHTDEGDLKIKVVEIAIRRVYKRYQIIQL